LYLRHPEKGLSGEKTLAMIMLLANETKAHTAFLCLLSFLGKRVERGKKRLQ